MGHKHKLPLTRTTTVATNVSYPRTINGDSPDETAQSLTIHSYEFGAHGANLDTLDTCEQGQFNDDINNNTNNNNDNCIAQNGQQINSSEANCTEESQLIEGNLISPQNEIMYMYCTSEI